MFHTMMSWAVSNRLQRRTILVCSILLAVLACAALPGVSEASRKVRGYGFATIVPSDWHTGKGKQGPTRVYGAASKKTKPGVPANTMQLGISVIPVVDVERQLGRKLPSSLQELLGLMTQPPQGAQNVQLTAPFRTSTLGGRPAASGALQFSLGGTTMLQSQTVSMYRGQIYAVTYDLDMSLLYRGLTVLKSVHSHWRWRR
jgi:hypothetical protein